MANISIHILMTQVTFTSCNLVFWNFANIQVLSIFQLDTQYVLENRIDQNKVLSL